MKHPTPNPGGASAEYWKAARDDRLVLSYCTACAAYQWPVRAACSHCGAPLAWRDASGRGTLITWSVVNRAVNPELKDDAPYVVAFVQLEEGVRVFTNVVETKPDALRAGLRVRARFEPALDPAIHVPVFVPEES